MELRVVLWLLVRFINVYFTAQLAVCLCIYYYATVLYEQCYNNVNATLRATAVLRCVYAATKLGHHFQKEQIINNFFVSSNIIREVSLNL